MPCSECQLFKWVCYGAAFKGVPAMKCISVRYDTIAKKL